LPSGKPGRSFHALRLPVHAIEIELVESLRNRRQASTLRSSRGAEPKHRKLVPYCVQSPAPVG
jgi:hypothetical protein